MNACKATPTTEEARASFRHDTDRLKQLRREHPSWRNGSSLEGLSGEQLETFRRRAVPEPGAAIREAPVLTNDRRLDVPSTVVCTSMTSGQIKATVEEGYPWIAGLADLHHVTYVDLPTGHWPMWSRPPELAALIAAVAREASGY